MRFQITRLRAAAAAALLSVSLAAPALAGHDDWDDDDYRYRRGYPVHEHGRHCDHDWDRGRRHWRGGWGHDRGYYGRDYYSRHDHDYGYGCRPCGKRWGSRDKFHRHLRKYHGIPSHFVPNVVIAVDWGWLFRG
ncbi:MAG: hypothetical protein FJ091_02780 [Deltaproteobacteria bacterium]|nr:hypothetical protein [Deltaproteobacteria bacterium]